MKKREQECLAARESPSRKRTLQSEQQAASNQQYVEKFAKHIRKDFPGCPTGREIQIAEHACSKYSGRIGRTTSAKHLRKEAIRFAVLAHVRHQETEYDTLLARGYEKYKARAQVELNVVQILNEWEQL